MYLETPTENLLLAKKKKEREREMGIILPVNREMKIKTWIWQKLKKILSSADQFVVKGNILIYCGRKVNKTYPSDLMCVFYICVSFD